ERNRRDLRVGGEIHHAHVVRDFVADERQRPRRRSRTHRNRRAGRENSVDGTATPHDILHADLAAGVPILSRNSRDVASLGAFSGTSTSLPPTRAYKNCRNW